MMMPAAFDDADMPLPPALISLAPRRCHYYERLLIRHAASRRSPFLIARHGLDAAATYADAISPYTSPLLCHYIYLHTLPRFYY